MQVEIPLAHRTSSTYTAYGDALAASVLAFYREFYAVDLTKTDACTRIELGKRKRDTAGGAGSGAAAGASDGTSSGGASIGDSSGTVAVGVPVEGFPAYGIALVAVGSVLLLALVFGRRVLTKFRTGRAIRSGEGGEGGEGGAVELHAVHGVRAVRAVGGASGAKASESRASDTEKVEVV